MVFGFRIYKITVGFRDENCGVGFRIQGLGLGIYNLGFMVQNLGCGVLGLRLPVLSWNRTEADMERTVYCVIYGYTGLYTDM